MYPIRMSPSEFTARLHREAGIGPVQVMPLFSSLDPGVLADAAKLPRPDFLFVGRMTASKGVIPLLEQFAQLPQYDLTLVGEGDLRERLQREYSGHANIRFLGLIPQERLTGLYRAATALVFPSLAPETFGLSIAEAFACGTPAIVHDAGGSRELIDSTGGGIVYRTNAELLDALRAFADDPDLRIRLGRRARAGFENLYTQRRHVDAYLACIEEIRRTKL